MSKLSVNRNSFYLGVIVATFILAYTASRFWGFLEGPTIDVVSPQNGLTATSSLLTIEARAKYIAFITLNDRQIYIDEDGRLFEQLLLQSGYNIISIKATDRFGRKTERRLEVYYQQ